MAGLVAVVCLTIELLIIRSAIFYDSAEQYRNPLAGMFFQAFPLLLLF